LSLTLEKWCAPDKGGEMVSANTADDEVKHLLCGGQSTNCSMWSLFKDPSSFCWPFHRV